MKKVYLWGVCAITVLCIAFFLSWKEDSDLVSITLKGKEADVSYLIEVADTQQKAEQGLMWRKKMPQNQGMLFIFPHPRKVSMWMKNTYIPLDMIFLNGQNQVIWLHENARPLDESLISCPYPAAKVLELNAGEIKAQKIQLGDYLVY